MDRNSRSPSSIVPKAWANVEAATIRPEMLFEIHVPTGEVVKRYRCDTEARLLTFGLGASLCLATPPDEQDGVRHLR
jgi:hypothetical protein